MAKEDIPGLWQTASREPNERANWLLLADALDEDGEPTTADLLRARGTNAPATTARIRHFPHVWDGRACIRNIPVGWLDMLRHYGATDLDVLQSHTWLTQADLDAAWEYRDVNQDGIYRDRRKFEKCNQVGPSPPRVLLYPDVGVIDDDSGLCGDIHSVVAIHARGFLEEIGHRPLYAEYLAERGHPHRSNLIWRMLAEYLRPDRIVLMRYGLSLFRGCFRLGLAISVQLPCEVWLSCGPALWSQNPLTRVVLTNKAPLNPPNREDYSDAKWRYWRWFAEDYWADQQPAPGTPECQATLPPQFFNLLPNRGEDLPGIAGYRRREIALDALSAACLAWAEHQYRTQ